VLGSVGYDGPGGRPQSIRNRSEESVEGTRHRDGELAHALVPDRIDTTRIAPDRVAVNAFVETTLHSNDWQSDPTDD
jgi:hypothetical protein